MLRGKGLFLIFSVLIASLFLIGLAFAASRQAHSTDYLREMPSAERVLADIRGKDPLETAERQIAALCSLRNMILLLQEGGEFGRSRTAEEQAVLASYYGAIDAIKSKASFDPGERRRLHLYQQDQILKGGWETIDKKLLKRYFSPEWHAKYTGIAANPVAVKLESTLQPFGPAFRLPPVAALFLTSPALMAYIAFLIGLMWFSLRGHFEADPSDSRKIILGPARYHLHSATGTVLSPTKEREVRTHISGGGSHPSGGGSQSVTSSTTTITHVQFFIKQVGGAEHPVQLQDIDLALRDGQKLSAVWAIKDGKPSGHYLFFRNHSTQRIDVVDTTFNQMVGPKSGLVLLFSLPFLLLPCIPYYFARRYVIAKRMRQVKQHIREQLLPKLDAEAKAI